MLPIRVGLQLAVLSLGTAAEAVGALGLGTEAGRADLARGKYKALALRDSFWSWLLERARTCPAAGG